MKITKVKDLSTDELDYLIKQKILEILGDSDTGLELSEEFKQELERRLNNPSKGVHHSEVVKNID